jgi:hypothetical protein
MAPTVPTGRDRDQTRDTVEAISPEGGLPEEPAGELHRLLR